ncbi:urease accessory protein UreE [Glutamicibacter endophyticus]
MLIDSLQGNLHELDEAQAQELAHLHREYVLLSGAQLTKRIQRLRTDHDRELGLRLPGGHRDLRDGDILHRDEKGLVAVKLLATDVLVISPRSIEQALFTAHSLGNRHLQAQFFGPGSAYGAEVMVVQYDHTVSDFLDAHQVPYERAERVMPVPFRHAEHTH